MAKAYRSNFKKIFDEANDSSALEDKRPSRPTGTTRIIRKSVLVADIRPNPYNSFNMGRDEQYEDLLEGIKKNGAATEEILCQPEDENGIYYIISGERRWKALTEAGIEKTTIKVLPNRLTGSAEITEIMNANLGRRGTYPYDMPLGIHDLYEAFEKEGITDPSEKRNRAKENLRISSDRTFRNYNKLAELPRGILTIGRDGLLTRDDGLFIADMLSSEEHCNFAKAAIEDIIKVGDSELSDDKKGEEIKIILTKLRRSTERKAERIAKEKKTAALSIAKKIDKLTSCSEYTLPKKPEQRQNMVEMLDKSLAFLQDLKNKLTEED